jgi:hypothetical protein
MEAKVIKNSLFSTMIKAGKTTYFVDVQVTRENKKYISITQTSFYDEKPQRATVRVFGEAATDQLLVALHDAAREMKKPITQPQEEIPHD